MAVFHGAFFPSLKFLKKPTNQPTHQDNYGKSFPQLLSRFAPSQPWKTFTHSCLLFAQLRFAHRLDLFIKIKKIKRGMWKKFPTVAQSLRSSQPWKTFTHIPADPAESFLQREIRGGTTGFFFFFPASNVNGYHVWFSEQSSGFEERS